MLCPLVTFITCITTRSQIWLVPNRRDLLCKMQSLSQAIVRRAIFLTQRVCLSLRARLGLDLGHLGGRRPASNWSASSLQVPKAAISWSLSLRSLTDFFSCLEHLLLPLPIYGVCPPSTTNFTSCDVMPLALLNHTELKPGPSVVN